MSSSSPSIEDLIRDGRVTADLIQEGRQLLEKETKGPPNLYGTLYAFARNNLPALLDALEAAQSDLRSLETEGSAKQRIRFAQENDALRAENERLRAHFDNCQADKIVTLVLERDALRAELLAARTALDKMAPIELKMLGEQTTDRIAAWRAARGEGTK